jgi:hypothetical protein
MKQNVILLFLGILLVGLIVSPVAASQILTSVSCTPNPPLVPGDHQQMIAQYTVIPSGSTTFPKGHSLQMQTDLVDAQWTIQVIVDGNNAARQTASGNAAFVSGGILSYPTNHDVSFTIAISGEVPKTANGTVPLLNMVELDNTGSPVPGSQSLITQPVAGTGTIPVSGTTLVPTLTPPLVTPSAAPTRSPGFLAEPVIAAMFIAGLVWMRKRQ